MILGIVLKGLNAREKGDKLTLVHEVVPQILLLSCLFGFMNILVITKWLTDYSGRESSSPSVITVMLDMFLSFGVPNPNSKEVPILTHQTFWSRVMLIIAVVTPPWMLFAKPFILRQQHLQTKVDRDKRGGDVELRESPRNNDSEDEERIELVGLMHKSPVKSDQLDLLTEPSVNNP